MIQSKRLLWADSLKGWLMILVVFGHAMQAVMPDGCFHNHLWNMIYSFHMPAFMTVSGYFAYRVHKKMGGQIAVLQTLSSTDGAVCGMVGYKLCNIW